MGILRCWAATLAAAPPRATACAGRPRRNYDGADKEAAMSDRIRVEIKGGVADVRLIRADKMNALDSAMMRALVETGERLKGDPSVRAVVLSGEGRAFCAGIDMGMFREIGSTGGVSVDLLPAERTGGGANHPQQAALVWREIPVPVIAAVHGVAFGAGLQVALGADLRFVTADAQLSVMEIKWGLAPDMAGVPLMRRLLRDDVARDLTYTGRVVSGEEAVAIGLATRVCADPLSEALAYAAEVAGRSPSAIRAAKRLMNACADATDAELLLAESVEQTALMGSPDQIEAVRANIEKRPPRFAG
jgi:enoyl-CoA hydratase/carnithine racemase